MKSFEYTITDNEGIHARPAGELVKVAKQYNSTVLIGRDGRMVDCKKIFGIMGLGVKKDQVVTFSIEGEDEDQACDAIRNFMSTNL